MSNTVTLNNDTCTERTYKVSIYVVDSITLVLFTVDSGNSELGFVTNFVY